MMKARFARLKAALLVVAGLLILPPESHAAGGFAGGVFRTATCDIIWYMQGSLGSLLIATGMLMSIAAAAMGNMKVITATICAAIGCYAMYDIVTMQFEDMGCAATGQGRAGRSATVLTASSPAAVNRDDTEQKSTLTEKPILAISPSKSESAPLAARQTEDADEDAVASSSWKTLSADE